MEGIMMARRGIWKVFAVALAAAAIAALGSVREAGASPGCDAVNAGSWNIFASGRTGRRMTGNFATGDELAFTIMAQADEQNPAVYEFDGTLSNGGALVLTQDQSVFPSFTVPGDGSGSLTIASVYGIAVTAASCTHLPTVTSISPNAGSTRGGTVVNITGTNFTEPAQVKVTIGGTAATGVTVVSATSITAITGAHPAAGLVDVAVTNKAGTATGSNLFRYVTSNPHDFNGDGTSDIAWRDTSGNVAFWLMAGAVVLPSQGPGQVPTDWSIVGQRDFDGDGFYDLLWRDTNGNVAMWLMNGTKITASLWLGQVSTDWTVIGTADFNGDGKGDILWRDSSGDLMVWLMNGGQILSSATIGNVPTAFTVVGVGDFDGDGKADILWRDNLGNTSIWFMDGTTVASMASLGNIPTTWSVLGTGDFNGDGMTDIVWRDTAGNISIWQMNAAAVLSAGAVGNVPIIWSLVQTGDYDGDLKSDLLWRDTSGNTAIWFMNGPDVSSTASLGNVPTTWSVQSLNAE
jgi:IPT/TIG domain/FG-GAP-like repeat